MSFFVLFDDDVFQPLSLEEDDNVELLDFFQDSSKCDAGLGRDIRLVLAEEEGDADDDCNGYVDVAI